jgi:hypothetical protein
MRVKLPDEKLVDKPVPPITPDMVKPPTPPTPQLVDNVPATRPADNGEMAIAPTTKPADTATASMDTLETQLIAAGKMPLAQQPIDELLTGYRTVAANASLPEATRKNAESRVKLLEIRQDALKSIADANAARQKRAAEQLPLEAEAKEIGQRMATAEFKNYAAVGTVRSSSLAANGRSLYRLTDPATGRTVVYLDDVEGRAPNLEGQFIGVRGVVTDDPTRQIKLLKPQAIDPVDPADLKTGTVRSALIPASLTATADASR